MTDDSDPDETEPTDLKFVGPATAELLSAASFGPDAIRRKEVSFSMLLDAGVNPGVAARIRREHSLAWSFETEDRQDLDRRSSQIRGLGDGERAWVSASSGDWTEEDAADSAATTPDRDTDEEVSGDWSITGADLTTPATDDAGEDGDGPDAASGDGTTADAEADGSGDPVAAESAWRRRSSPVPVSELDGVDQSVQRTLASAGITSVRSLANADPETVADALGMDESEVADLRDAAESYTA